MLQAIRAGVIVQRLWFSCWQMPHDGALQELVQGMLKIRGDLTKSEANPETSSLSVVGSMYAYEFVRFGLAVEDTVASLLATKSLQSMFTQMRVEWAQTLDTLTHMCALVHSRCGPELQPRFEHHSDAGVDQEPTEQHRCFQPRFPLSPLPPRWPTKPDDVTTQSDTELDFLPTRLSQCESNP